MHCEKLILREVNYSQCLFLAAVVLTTLCGCQIVRLTLKYEILWLRNNIIVTSQKSIFGYKLRTIVAENP